MLKPAEVSAAWVGSGQIILRYTVYKLKVIVLIHLSYSRYDSDCLCACAFWPFGMHYE